MSWFRFYDDVVNDPKVQRLDPNLFKAWVNLLCIASKHNGKIPSSLDDVAFVLRASNDAVLMWIDALIDAGLIDEFDGFLSPHNWQGRQFQSDKSTERVRKFRSKNNDMENKRRNVSKAQDQPKADETVRNVSVTPQNRAEQIQKQNISLTSSAHPIADADGDAGPSTEATPSKSRKADDWPTGAFGIFWARYPAKVGKAAAERKFETVRKSGRVAWGDLTAGLEAYIANKPPDRDWCHPTTWLNQGRWDDQYGQGANDDAGSRNQQKSASERTADMFLAGFAAVAGAQRVERLDRPADPVAAGDGGGKIVDLRAAR